MIHLKKKQNDLRALKRKLSCLNNLGCLFNGLIISFSIVSIIKNGNKNGKMEKSKIYIS